MPTQLPSEPLCLELCGAGVPPAKHARRSLRTIIHRSTGEPPDERKSADELAREILLLASVGRLVID